MFNKNFKRIRSSQGYSQKQLAEFLNISPQSVSKWETGEALPSIEFLPRMAELFECKIDDFFVECDNGDVDVDLIKRYLELEAKIFKKEIENEEYFEEIKGFTLHHLQIKCFLNSLKARKTLKKTKLLSFLNCNEITVNEILMLLLDCEIISPLDEHDLYLINSDIIRGMCMMLTLFVETQKMDKNTPRTNKEIYELAQKIKTELDD